MNRRISKLSLLCVILLLATGCAHQREQVFPGKSGGFWGMKPAPAPAVSAGKASQVSKKPDRVEQNARRMPGFDHDEPFDFDQAL